MGKGNLKLPLSVAPWGEKISVIILCILIFLLFFVIKNYAYAISSAVECKGFRADQAGLPRLHVGSDELLKQRENEHNFQPYCTPFSSFEDILSEGKAVLVDASFVKDILLEHAMYPCVHQYLLGNLPNLLGNLPKLIQTKPDVTNEIHVCFKEKETVCCAPLLQILQDEYEDDKPDRLLLSLPNRSMDTQSNS